MESSYVPSCLSSRNYANLGLQPGNLAELKRTLNRNIVVSEIKLTMIFLFYITLNDRQDGILRAMKHFLDFLTVRFMLSCTHTIY